MKEVLDSKFLLTHYFSKDEAILSRTRAKLAALRRARLGVLPSIVIAEVMNAVCQNAGRKEAMEKFRSLESAGLEVVLLDSPLAYEAARIQCSHRTLPMADCIIAATALHLGALVVSDDPHFSKIRGLRTTWI